MRASQVVYDRAGASIANVDASEFDFDKIFDGAVWFHTTGITPALSDKAAALTEAALKAAKAKGITTSIGHRSMVNCGNAIIGKTSYVMKNHIKPFRNTL